MKRTRIFLNGLFEKLTKTDGGAVSMIDPYEDSAFPPTPEVGSVSDQGPTSAI
jgi:hypothetical protein